MESPDLKELPLKIDIFCVYNGEESAVPLLFALPAARREPLKQNAGERRKVRIIHEKIHRERAVR